MCIICNALETRCRRSMSIYLKSVFFDIFIDISHLWIVNVPPNNQAFTFTVTIESNSTVWFQIIRVNKSIHKPIPVPTWYPLPTYSYWTLCHHLNTKDDLWALYHEYWILFYLRFQSDIWSGSDIDHLPSESTVEYLKLRGSFCLIIKHLFNCLPVHR